MAEKKDSPGCPFCGTKKVSNPSLKLMVNTCGHSLCEVCVTLLFAKGSGECPVCHVTLRRINYRMQLFEDASIEKDVNIRRKILKDFNKKEGDFATLREFNDYLELVETIIFNLSNDINVTSTNAQVEAYKAQNQQGIKKNRSKLSKDEELIEMLIEQEQEEQEISRQLIIQEQNKAKQQKRQADDFIDDLMSSDLPADHILQSHHVRGGVAQVAAAAATTKTPSSFISRLAQKNVYNPTADSEPVPVEVNKPFIYLSLEIDYRGPKPPTFTELNENNYLSHIRAATIPERSGGFISSISCQRALQDAFCGLYFSFPDSDSNAMS